MNGLNTGLLSPSHTQTGSTKAQQRTFDRSEPLTADQVLSGSCKQIIYNDSQSIFMQATTSRKRQIAEPVDMARKSLPLTTLSLDQGAHEGVCEVKQIDLGEDTG